MKSSSLVNSNFGWMLSQLPKTTIASAMFREGCRTKNADLIHAVLHSLGEDLGLNYVSKWLQNEILPTMPINDRIYFDELRDNDEE